MAPKMLYKCPICGTVFDLEDPEASRIKALVCETQPVGYDGVFEHSVGEFAIYNDPRACEYSVEIIGQKWRRNNRRGPNLGKHEKWYQVKIVQVLVPAEEGPQYAVGIMKWVRSASLSVPLYPDPNKRSSDDT